MSAFGDRLREARSATGMTQDRLGAELGVTKAAISGWENNRDYPSFTVLAKLRDALSVSLDYLVCGEAGRTTTYSFPIAESKASYSHAIDVGGQRSLSTREYSLVQRFRSLSSSRQEALLALLRPDS